MANIANITISNIEFKDINDLLPESLSIGTTYLLQSQAATLLICPAAEMPTDPNAGFIMQLNKVISWKPLENITLYIRTTSDSHCGKLNIAS